MDRLIPIIVVIAAVASWWWFEQVLTGGRARSPLWMAFSMTAVSAVYLVSGLIGYTLDRHDRFVARTAWAGGAGLRVSYLRSAVVLSPRGGALSRLIPLFKAGLGGRVGSGRQFWSWISLRDHIRGVRYVLDHDDLSGPVNIGAPEPVTNQEFTRALARALHRPSFFVAPGPPLKVVLGGFGADLLTGQRAVPDRLEKSGFRFDDPDIDSALAWVLAERR